MRARRHALHASRTHPRRARFVDQAPVRITGPRHGQFTPHIRSDRVDALAALFHGLPVARGSALIASATELLGGVVRDAAVLAAVRDGSRPAGGALTTVTGKSDHPAVWRAAVVALGLLGVGPNDADWQVATAAMEYDRAAVILAAMLALPGEADVVPMESWVAQSPVGAPAGRRLPLGRLMTVVG